MDSDQDHGHKVLDQKNLCGEARLFEESSPLRTRNNPIVSNDIDIVYTIAGDQCIIGTWPLNSSNLAINITKGNGARLNAFIGGSIGKHTTVQFGRLILKYNHSIMEASLMFDKVSREDEGLYEILETFYMPKSAPYDTVPEAYKRKDGRWSLELNILERGEVQQGEVGENITMEFEILSEISTLYIFDTVGSVLQSCSISTQSHLYGRLRCVSDDFHKTYRITIDNVTQRDAGLYKLSTERDKRWRRFLNITEKPTCAVVGENMTFGWFYNQQGIKRTLLVIHPNQEVIMQLAPTHVPEIKRKFQHRFSYKGNVSGSFMLLTLLNVSKSDAGLYSIETLHGNIIPGWKQLNVDGACTTISRTPTSVLLPVPLNPYLDGTPLYESATNVFSTKEETVSFQPTDIRCVPIYVVIPVSVVVLALMGCVIWIHHKRNSTLETDADRPHSLKECDTESYITPIGGERHLPIPLMNDGHAADSITAQLDSHMLLLHTNQSLNTDGYEMVDVSSNDASKSVFNNDETVYEPPETFSNPVHDNLGYLTVLGVLETSV